MADILDTKIGKPFRREVWIIELLERSSDLSTVFNLQTAHHELVLCVLPLILSLCSLKRSIEGKPVQFHRSKQKPQSDCTGKHMRSVFTPLTVPGSPLKANTVAFAMENKQQSLLLFC